MDRVKYIEKSVNKKAGKRLSARGRSVVNFFIRSLFVSQIIAYILVVSVIVFCSFAIERTIDGNDRSLDYAIMSISLAFFGAMVSVLAVLISKETEKYVGRSILKFTTFHTYFINNVYFIVVTCMIFLLYLLVNVIKQTDIIAFSFALLFSSVISIVLLIRIIIIDKAKLLLNNYLPLHKRLLIDSVIPSKKSFNDFFIKDNNDDFIIGKDEDVQYVFNKNKYISKYNLLFEEFVNYFLSYNNIINEDVRSLAALIKLFRVKQYDYDSIVYFSYFSDQLFAIFSCYIKEGYNSEVYRLMMEYLNKVESILRSSEVKKLFIHFDNGSFSKEELLLSNRINEQTRAQILFCFSFSKIKELSNIISLFNDDGSYKVSGYKGSLESKLSTSIELINAYQEIGLGNSEMLLSFQK